VSNFAPIGQAVAEYHEYELRVNKIEEIKQRLVEVKSGKAFD